MPDGGALAHEGDERELDIFVRMSMKRFILALFVAVLILAPVLKSGGSGTTYYVSVADGDDSYDGTEQTHTTGVTGPWKTIAKVNAASFSAGDSILFKRGETWHETLTVPSSGSAGNVITFGAYGTWNSPDISCWGDSLTYGQGSTGGNTYPADLATDIGNINVYNYGVSGNTSTDIKNRMVATYGRLNNIAVIWAGRNNFQSPTTVKADIATMVAAVQSNNGKYIILGVTNSNWSGEWSGQDLYNTIVQLNSDLATLYPNNFIDIRSIIIANHDQSSQDLIDYGHDTLPTSLTYTDGTHLNNTGYALVATTVANFISGKSWTATGYPIIDGSDVFSSFTTENQGSTATVSCSPAATADDSERWRTGWWDNGSGGWMSVDKDGSDWVDGQFRGTLNVPKSATITAATITIAAYQNAVAGGKIDISAEATDDAAAIANSSDFATRIGNLTSNPVTWTTGALTAGVSITSPDVSSVVQQIVNRSGWAANNHINIFFVANTSGTTRNNLCDYSHGSGYAAMSVSYSVPGPDFYYKAYSTEPNQIFWDGQILTKQAVKANLATGQWYDDTGNSRIYLYDNPSGHTITADQRATVVLNGKNYITLSALRTQYSSGIGINITGGSSGTTIQNCDVLGCYTIGVLAYSATTAISGTITGTTVRYNGDDGIQVSRNSATWTVSNNDVHHNCFLPIETWEAGIKILGSTAPIPTNIIVERNHVHDNTYTPTKWIYRGCGIWFDTVGSGCVARYNLVNDNTIAGIEVEASASAVQVHHNIIYNHTAYQADTEEGVGIYIIGRATLPISGTQVYNNTVFNCRELISVQGDGSAGTCTNNLVKNNIFLSPSGTGYRHFTTWGGGENDGTNGSGNVYTYNCFGAEPLAITYPAGGATITTYSAFATAYGAATYNVTSDPLVVSTVTPDFHLQASSPCRNVGVNVSLTTDYDGRGVANRPCIGAYDPMMRGWAIW